MDALPQPVLFRAQLCGDTGEASFGILVKYYEVDVGLGRFAGNFGGKYFANHVVQILPENWANRSGKVCRMGAAAKTDALTATPDTVIGTAFSRNAAR